MKTTITIAVLAALLIANIGVAEAGRRKKGKSRLLVYEFVYTRPALGTSGTGVGTEGLSFNSTSTHVYLTLELTDDVSPTGYATLSWDTDGDGVSDTGFTVCGETDSLIQIPPNTTVNVFNWALPGPECASGFSTSGKVKATLSAHP